MKLEILENVEPIWWSFLYFFLSDGLWWSEGQIKDRTIVKLKSFELQKIPDVEMLVYNSMSTVVNEKSVFSLLTVWTGGSSEKKESKLCTEGR